MIRVTVDGFGAVVEDFEDILHHEGGDYGFDATGAVQATQRFGELVGQDMLFGSHRQIGCVGFRPELVKTGLEFAGQQKGTRAETVREPVSAGGGLPFRRTGSGGPPGVASVNELASGGALGFETGFELADGFVLPGLGVKWLFVWQDRDSLMGK